MLRQKRQKEGDDQPMAYRKKTDFLTLPVLCWARARAAWIHDDRGNRQRGNGGSPKGLSAPMHRRFGPWEWCNFQNTKYCREVRSYVRAVFYYVNVMWCLKLWDIVSRKHSQFNYMPVVCERAQHLLLVFICRTLARDCLLTIKGWHF